MKTPKPFPVGPADGLGAFAARGAAAQSAADKVIADHQVDAELGRQLVAVQALVEGLKGAQAIRVPPPAPATEWPRLHDLIDQSAAKLPGKYRGEVMRLERRIRAELDRVIWASVEAGNSVVAGGDAGRWAYQAGALQGLLGQFIGRQVATPPTPPAGRGVE